MKFEGVWKFLGIHTHERKGEAAELGRGKAELSHSLTKQWPVQWGALGRIYLSELSSIEPKCWGLSVTLHSHTAPGDDVIFCS